MAQPARYPVALQEICEGAPDRYSFVAHRRKNEDFLDRQLLGKYAVQSHVGEHPAGDAEVPRRMSLEQAPNRDKHLVLEHLLDRGGEILAGGLFCKLAQQLSHCPIVSQIRPNSPVVLHLKMPIDLFLEDRISQSRQPGELALVPVGPETQCSRGSCVSLSETVDIRPFGEAVISTVDFL